MAVNSRQKGCRGERELRDVLRAAGFAGARRGQQFAGGTESPDVIVPELPTIHWECKRVQVGNPYKWLAQAIKDSSGGGIVSTLTPVVAHKRNGEDWLAVLRLSDLIQLLKDAGRVTQ